MDHIYIRRLMGQKSGLEDSYLKLSEEELLEGDSKHIGYIGVIDQLTINEENKLKRKVQTLTVEKSRIDKLEQENKEFKEWNNEYRQRIEKRLSMVVDALGLK
jgi:phage FluMu gp28-like protein